MGRGSPILATLFLYYYVLSYHREFVSCAPQQHKANPDPPKEVRYTPLELLVTAAAAAFGGALLRGPAAKAIRFLCSKLSCCRGAKGGDLERGERHEKKEGNMVF